MLEHFKVYNSNNDMIKLIEDDGDFCINISLKSGYETTIWGDRKFIENLVSGLFRSLALRVEIKNPKEKLGGI